MKKNLKKIFIYYILILFIFWFLFIFSFNYDKNKRLEKKINKEKNEELDDIEKIQEFINININLKLINTYNNLYHAYFPKISIVIAVYNGEGYIESALCSIRNQDFKDIEIIIVDDNSKDNSIELIQKIMKSDPRIFLLKNKVNKGALYSKTRGVLKSRGKYVMILDVDDMYASKEAFSILYNTAEKNNLHILGFSSLISRTKINKTNLLIHNYIETPIICQPKVREKMYSIKNGKIKRFGNVLWCYFFRTRLFKKAIKRIDKNLLNRIMNVHDDLLCFFILTRIAKNIMYIKRVFHFYNIKTDQLNNSKILFQLKEKKISSIKYNCLAYLYYDEYILKNTDNNFYDKQFASFEFEKNYLNHSCKYNNITKKEGIKISLLYLRNKHIKNDIKKLILNFLNETNNFNSFIKKENKSI